MAFSDLPLPNGPDPGFPYLGESERFAFPDPLKAAHHSVVAWGGNLSPGMLLSGYEQGLFPWYTENEPVIWHSPDPRFVIFPEKLHVSASMKKVLKRGEFSITFNRDFPGVIAACSAIQRPGQTGSWITSDMIAAYTELHRLGWAHSAEAYVEGELTGGCYGVRMGNVFFGESMFSRAPNASKAAFLTFARLLFDEGVRFIDSQAYTSHMESLGAREIRRRDFIALLKDAREPPPRVSIPAKSSCRGGYTV
ncbi:MAG: leucyl/phenylalanyl-tRNA--protein transferase [Treponema sp.]|nr:leucyl/phenylalanyl-tRNA--protein transferase [Treponema sp.]